MSRARTIAVAVALALGVLFAAPGTAAALPGWSLMADPLASAGRLDAAATFGDAGVVVAGANGGVAVSSNGGKTWKDVSPTDLPAPAPTDLTGVAFIDGEHGVVVGEAGTILVGEPGDSGLAWMTAALPLDVTDDFHDVAMSGTVGYAVGVGGMILRTVDGGISWRRQNAQTTADLNAVAVTADGDLAVAVGAQGTLLVNDNGTWDTLDSGSSADLLDVVLPSSSAAAAIYYCAAGQVYSLQGAGPGAPLAAQPTLPTGVTLNTLALVESSAPDRLIAGGSGGFLAGFVVGGGAWAKQTPASTAAVTSLAAGGGVCYATTAGGRVERTLSAGRAYALTLTAKPAAPSGSSFKAVVTTGASVNLSAATTVLAPGVLLLQARPAGAATWSTVASGSPGATTLSGSYAPTLNTTYRVRFLFAGAVAATGTGVPIGVRHKVSVATLTMRLRLHDVYRVHGSVAPVHPSGSVEIWTDRAGDRKLGPWHRITNGAVAQLVNGRTFTTRTFGTPVVETYHLKIRMAGDARHLQGWSPRITVSIR